MIGAHKSNENRRGQENTKLNSDSGIEPVSDLGRKSVMKTGEAIEHEAHRINLDMGGYYAG
jgi:hypothetical protein